MDHLPCNLLMAWLSRQGSLARPCLSEGRSGVDLRRQEHKELARWRLVPEVGYTKWAQPALAKGSQRLHFVEGSSL